MRNLEADWAERVNVRLTQVRCSIWALRRVWEAGSGEQDGDG